VDLAGRTRETMQEFLRRATERKIDRLSRLITESFRFLLHKETLVEQILIDAQSFGVTLFLEGRVRPSATGGTGMTIKQVRVSSQAREQLIRLKTRTGIGQWNILCRWAFCLSLRQPTPPTPIDIPADSNVEMSWQVFGGEAQELYLALLKERCERDGLGTSDEVLARQFRLHLHRGISYLATPHTIKSITDLVRLAVEEGETGCA
jgi:DNA sulfur modification protein DndE